MPRRLATLVLAAVALAAATLGQHGPALHAQTPAPAGIDLVRAVYNDLLDRFFRIVQPSTLLGAGWDSLRLQLGSVPPLAALPDDRAGAFDAFSRQFESYEAGLGAEPRPVDPAFAVVDGMAKSLHDQHTALLPPDLFRSVLAELGGGKPIGPGIRIAARFPLTVSAVAPGGPAEQAGMLPGDQLDTIDGTGVLNLSQSALIRGLETAPAGTTVAYGITRDSQRLEIRVTYGPYFFPVLQSRLLPGGVAYLALTSFTDARIPLPDGTVLLDDLDRGLDDLDAQGAGGLVLDLRGNPGGSIVTAQELLGRFLPEDATTVVQSDERGHQITGIVAGGMRGRQLPMAVLVDRGSASASELVAVTLQEAKRAVVVGDRTIGALTSSNILPLPEDAGLQVAVADILTARRHERVDGTGVRPDVQATDTRRAADFRDGRDPQLDAAVQALSQAPAVPPYAPPYTGLTAAELDRLLDGYIPAAAQLPTNDRLPEVIDAGSGDVNHANEAVGIGARDPEALLQQIRDSGWLGEHARSFASGRRTPPFESIAIDLYRTPEGAARRLGTNAFPDEQQQIGNPVQLGDQTVSYRGTWFEAGATEIAWRHGAVVLRVAYTDLPGNERPDTLVALARLFDANYERKPLPADATAPAAVLTATPVAGAVGAGAPTLVTPSVPTVAAAMPVDVPHIVQHVESGPAALVLSLAAAGLLGLATALAVLLNTLRRN